MTQPTAPGTTPPSPPGPAGATGAPPVGPAAESDGDWTDQVTDLIVDSVDKVRSRTTGPILEISQGAVHAVVALILLVPVFALGIVGLVRLLDWAVPGDVWIVYAGLGTLLVLIGVVLWRLRRPRRG